MYKKQLLITVFFTLLPFCAMADNIKIGDLYYKTNPDNYTACVINGYFVDGNNKYTGDIIIPEIIEYEGNTYTVNSIQKGAYSDGGSPYYGGPFDCSNITSIIIPKTITQIDEYTFNGCRKLKTVTFCGDINKIGNGAFAYCELLANVIIPNGLESIGDEAFSNCSSLSSVTIPNSVMSIGTSAFESCSGLTTVIVQCSPTDIGISQFRGCSNLKEVTFDCETVTCLFSGTSIEKVTMKECVTSIGAFAFSGCRFLTSVTIPNSVTSIGSSAFESCSGLTSVTIPNSVISIGDATFSGCRCLTSVTISANIQKIGDGVFDGCISLESLIIPPSVSSIGHFAFRDCNSLRSLIIETEKAPYCVNESFGDWTENATLHVKDYAVETFKGVEPWSNFKEIVVDEKVTDFNLIYIIDGEEYKVVKYKYDDEIIPEEYPLKEGYSFSGWEGLPQNMPGKEVKVYGTFVRNEVKENGIIYWALNEKAVVLGNDNASGGVSISEEVSFNEKELPVTEIMDNAFNGCKGITTIDMPATITSIGKRAFANIDKLTNVTVNAVDVPETDRTAFENSYIEDYVTLHVQYGSVDKYKTAAPWKNFKEIVAIERTQRMYTLTYLVDGDVYKSYEVKEGETIIPETEPVKEGYSFSGWSEIPETMPAEDVIIIGTFTQIEYDVDGNKYVIDDDEATIVDGGNVEGEVVIDATITINGKTYKVTVIGEGAYQGNDKITSVEIPNSVETILTNAFFNCGNINTLKIGKTIKHIGSKAFGNIGLSAVGRRASDNPLTIECHAESMPEVEADCFDGTPITNAVLLVEDSLVESYKAVAPWCYFGEIKGFNEASGIDTIFVGQQNAAIYSIDGQRLDEPRKGMNIIKTSQGVKKVMVK